MASYNFKWYEELSSPWDFDCRDKFVIHRSKYPLDYANDGNNVEARYQFYKKMREELEHSGKLEFLSENNIDMQTMKISAMLMPSTWHLNVMVLIDFPQQLRTLYALRFTE